MATTGMAKRRRWSQSQALERRRRVVDEHDREIAIGAEPGRDACRHGAGRAPQPRVAHEGVAVLVGAADREERVAGTTGPAVDGHPGHEGIQPAADEGALGAADELGDASGGARRPSARRVTAPGQELARDQTVVERPDLVPMI